jgi:type II secretory pathway pseudopilin PulG
MGALAKVQGLTVSQRELVTAIANGATIKAASKTAGYSNLGAAYSALAVPAVQTAIRQRVEELLLVDAAYARRVLRRLARSNKTEPKLRRQAAVDLLSRGGFVPPKARDGASNAAATLSEMTPAQLRALVDAGQRALSDRAAPIIDGQAVEIEDSAPVSDDISPELAELLG